MAQERIAKIVENDMKETQPLFDCMMKEMSEIEIWTLKLDYRGGFDNLKPNRKHEIVVNHLRQVVGIFPPFSPKIIIPFEKIKGARLKRENGTFESDITGIELIKRGCKKRVFLIDIDLIYKGKSIIVTYSNKQTQADLDNSVFALEYILNNLPNLADYFAARREEENRAIQEQNNEINARYEKSYELADTMPKTEYHLQYCEGLNDFNTCGEATLILDRSFFLIQLPASAPIMIPLQSIKNSESYEDCQVDIPDANDDSVFYIKISYTHEGKDRTLTFSKKQKHLQKTNPVGQLNYLLHKRMNYFNSASSASAIDLSVTKQIPIHSSNIEKQDYIQELRSLKSLLDDGIITQEEFDTKKNQLLNL